MLKHTCNIFLLFFAFIGSLSAQYEAPYDPYNPYAGQQFSINGNPDSIPQSYFMRRVVIDPYSDSTLTTRDTGFYSKSAFWNPDYWIYCQAPQIVSAGAYNPSKINSLIRYHFWEETKTEAFKLDFIYHSRMTYQNIRKFHKGRYDLCDAEQAIPTIISIQSSVFDYRDGILIVSRKIYYSGKVDNEALQNSSQVKSDLFYFDLVNGIELKPGSFFKPDKQAALEMLIYKKIRQAQKNAAMLAQGKETEPRSGPFSYPVYVHSGNGDTLTKIDSAHLLFAFNYRGNYSPFKPLVSTPTESSDEYSSEGPRYENAVEAPSIDAGEGYSGSSGSEGVDYPSIDPPPMEEEIRESSGSDEEYIPENSVRNESLWKGSRITIPSFRNQTYSVTMVPSSLENPVDTLRRILPDQMKFYTSGGGLYVQIPEYSHATDPCIGSMMVLRLGWEEVNSLINPAGPFRGLLKASSHSASIPPEIYSSLSSTTNHNLIPFVQSVDTSLARARSIKSVIVLENIYNEEGYDRNRPRSAYRKLWFDQGGKLVETSTFDAGDQWIQSTLYIYTKGQLSSVLDVSYKTIYEPDTVYQRYIVTRENRLNYSSGYLQSSSMDGQNTQVYYSVIGNKIAEEFSLGDGNILANTNIYQCENKRISRKFNTTFDATYLQQIQSQQYLYGKHGKLLAANSGTNQYITPQYFYDENDHLVLCRPRTFGSEYEEEAIEYKWQDHLLSELFYAQNSLTTKIIYTPEGLPKEVVNINPGYGSQPGHSYLEYSFYP